MRVNKIALIGVLIFSIFTTGCGEKKEKPFMTRDRNILNYSQDDLPEDNYYILKKNGNFQPLLSKGVYDNHVWFSSFDNLIPVLESGDKLIYTSEKDKPYTFQFLEMKDIGWTVGIKFNMDYDDNEDSTIISFPSDTEGYSPFSKVGSIVGSKMQGIHTNITNINGKRISPIMFTENGFLKGLSKDSMYKFGYYNGTKYKTIDIMADTHVYISGDSSVSNSFKETKKGYMIVDLPNNLKNGIYKLGEDGGGLFKVDK